MGLYQDLRYGNNFQYNFAVPNGTYTVTLKFAEIVFNTKGARVFNLTINNQVELTNFDIGPKRAERIAPSTRRLRFR